MMANHRSNRAPTEQAKAIVLTNAVASISLGNQLSSLIVMSGIYGKTKQGHIRTSTVSQKCKKAPPAARPTGQV